MTTQLPLLQAAAPVVDQSGRPNAIFQQWWQSTVKAIGKNIDDIAAALAQAVDALNAAIAAQNAAIDALNAAVAAQGTADGATADAATAQSTADAAVAAAAVAQASADAAALAAAAAQTTADSKLDEVTADGLYVHQFATDPWIVPTGTISRAGFTTYSATAGAAYSQTDTQVTMDAVRDVSQALAALLQDLQANNTLA